MTVTQKEPEVKTVMKFWDTVIALTMSLATVVILASIHITAFQTAALAIVTRKDLKRTLAKMESVIVTVGQLRVTNVITVLRVIMIFQIVILVDVQMKEVLILFAMHRLETVTAKKM